MNMDFQEGYCDGLAGAGANREFILNDGYETFTTDYGEGFERGSLDRKTMLTQHQVDKLNDAFALWAEGMGDGDA
jgi:hypothetical protein